MAFDSRFLDELKDRIKPADVIGKRVKLTRKGREYQGLCPFHKEKTPSFYVYDDHYHCFGCGAHGSAIDFVMNSDNLSFPEAVERLALDAGMEIPVDTPEQRQRAEKQNTLIDVMEAACAFYQQQLKMPEGAPGRDYLARRGLDERAAERFRLGYAGPRSGGLKAVLARGGIGEELLVEAGLMKRPDDGRAPFDFFRNRVMIPIADRRGRVIAFGARTLGDGEPKYLNSPETPLFHKSRTLYGLDRAGAAARRKGTVVVTEGYMDVIALQLAGFATAVAPLGTALTEDQLQELWRLAPEPILCLDGDAAGRRAAARAAERALPLLAPGRSLRFALLPAGEDPDSLLKREGPGAMREVLEAARPLSESLWDTVVEGARADTPERRAALWKELKDRVFRIQDPTVRKSFLEDYERRFWDKPKGGGGRQARRPEGAAAARVDRVGREQQLLLAMLVFRPDLFEHVDEEIGRLQFRDPDDEALRQTLVLHLGRTGDPSAGEAHNALTEKGFGPLLDHIARLDEVRAMRRPGGVLHSDQPLEPLLDMWTQFMEASHKEDLRRGLPPASDDMSDDDLARRMEMIRAGLGEESS